MCLWEHMVVVLAQFISNSKFLSVFFFPSDFDFSLPILFKRQTVTSRKRFTRSIASAKPPTLERLVETSQCIIYREFLEIPTELGSVLWILVLTLWKF